MDFVSLTTTDQQSLLENKAQKAYKTFQNYGLRVRSLSYDKLYGELNFHLDSLILFSDAHVLSKQNIFQMHLEHIGKHKIRKTIWLLIILVLTKNLN